MKKFINRLLRGLKPKKYVMIKEQSVGVPMYSTVTNTCNPKWIPTRVNEVNLTSYTVRTKVLRKNELVAVAETGAFKVGDGVTQFDKLPWATRLPVIEQTHKKEI